MPPGTARARSSACDSTAAATCRANAPHPAQVELRADRIDVRSHHARHVREHVAEPRVVLGCGASAGNLRRVLPRCASCATNMMQESAVRPAWCDRRQAACAAARRRPCGCKSCPARHRELREPVDACAGRRNASSALTAWHGRCMKGYDRSAARHTGRGCRSRFGEETNGSPRWTQRTRHRREQYR